MADSSVKYPYPSGVNVAEFVTVKVSPVNYNIWKSMMIDLLKNNGLIGFIDGSIYMPPEIIGGVENPEFLQWAKSDGLVRRWILATVLEKDLMYLHQQPTARDMWFAIQRRSHVKPFYHQVKIDLIGTGTELSRYIPLSTAALNGDWKKAKEFLDKEPEAIKAYITATSETALMIAARSTDRIDLFKQLLGRMDPWDLALGNKHDMTTLHIIAAASGNTEAAKLLVEKNPMLPNMFDKSLRLPLHVAAIFGEKEMVLYLLSVTEDNAETKLFEGESGNKLMHRLIESGLYDVAFLILKKRPQLAFEVPTPLGALSVKRSSFRSGLRLSSYQNLIYSWVPLKLENIETVCGAGIEDINNNPISVKQKLHDLFWKIAEVSVPQMRSIREAKAINHHALELVKGLCSEIVKVDDTTAAQMLAVPLNTASCFGVREVVEEILASFPSAIYLTDEMNRTLFHLAIINRHENVFNIIYQIEHKHIFLRMQDAENNNCLHLAGCLESQQKLNLRDSAAGAALQVQRELQWFKAVKEFILKQDNEQINIKGQTPAMIFTETHESLIKEGEQWMKDTSNSCTIVGALIVTIVFAAAITVPGGNHGENGYPIFLTDAAFKIFAIADALALFASTSSVLMFLSILTSRYGEQDFLYALPKRLVIGLGTLFLSILFMMIAFGATIHIVFGHNRPQILIPVVLFSCAPVMLFMSLQFPLLWIMIKSTYGPGIFGKQSNRILF